MVVSLSSECLLYNPLIILFLVLPMLTFDTFISSSPWSLVHATTVIGIISMRFLVTNVPSKVPNVFYYGTIELFLVVRLTFKPQLS